MAEVTFTVSGDDMEHWLYENDVSAYFDASSGVYDGDFTGLIRAAIHTAKITYDDTPVKPVLRIVE